MRSMAHPPLDPETEFGVPSIDDVGKVREIAGHVRAIIEALGLDPSDPNLQETDERVAKMYLEMFHGLSEGAEPLVTVFPNEERYTAMVMGLARAQSAAGKYPEAAKNAKEALARAPEPQKKYIQGLVDKLQAGKDINS